MNAGATQSTKFCINCGAPVVARFCGNCGQPTAFGQQPPPQQPVAGGYGGVPVGSFQQQPPPQQQGYGSGMVPSPVNSSPALYMQPQQPQQQPQQQQPYQGLRPPSQPVLQQQSQPMLQQQQVIQQQPSVMIMQQQQQHQPWVVQITAIRAHQLPKLHGGFHKVDSFVRIRIGSGGAMVTYQTSVVKGTYDPDYGRHAFPPTPVEQIFSPITVEVWDAERNRADDLISSVSMSPAEILRLAMKGGLVQQALERPTFTFEAVLPLKTKKKRLTKWSGVSLTLGITLTWPSDLMMMSYGDRQAWFQNTAGGERCLSALKRWNIHSAYHDEMVSLNQWDIALICDDSGSMGSMEESSNMTRWEELKQIVKITIDISSQLHEDGLALSFLNRPGRERVRSWEDCHEMFRHHPSGTTPITQAVVSVMQQHQMRPKPLLLLIATDGEPDNVASFVSALASRDTSRVFVCILACSDKEEDVGFLEQIHAQIKNLDVIEEFKLEKRRVHREHRYAHYSQGDHAARFLLGAIYPKFDMLDFY